MAGKVLIVDDDDLVRGTYRRCLVQAGFDVDSAGSGREAQERLAALEYDVAVVDLLMPEIDGFQVLEWMQANAPGVISVVVSGTSRIEDAVRAVQEGAFDFVTKPVESLDVFVQQVRRAVDHKRLRDSHDRLLRELQQKNIELENRLGQLELAHNILQSQAVAIQVDLNRAMRLQRGVLPSKLPFSDRISLTAVYRPLAKVGGDLYDVFQLDDHRLGMYLADTSGHGVSSALLTIFLKHAVEGLRRSDALERVREPAVVLADLNRTILGEAFGQGIFVSMTYLVLDLDDGVMRYANAGHPPMLLRRTDGTIERLRQPAPVLGVNPDVAYTEDVRTLNPGDVLLLYSDGIPEARSVSGEFFGEEHLKEAFAAAEPHADAVAEAINKAVARFSEGRQRTDDITLLALGMEPQRTPFQGPEREERIKPPEAGQPGVKVHTARHDGRTFISLSGTGSWRESQQVLDLCDKARADGESSIVLDLSQCTHLDSTFLGVLHNIATSFDDAGDCRFELQNLPLALLREMSELGLTGVLMHFRHEPATLPESMQLVEGSVPGGEEMGHLLLWAHEALVDADPSNADRFAAVLQVLHDRAKKASQDRQRTPGEGN